MRSARRRDCCTGFATWGPGISIEQGFTLVEVLAAVALLSVGLLAVITASRAARDAQQRALYLAIGRNVAQSKIALLRSASFDTIATPLTTTQDPSLPKGNTVQVSVVPYPTTGEANLYRATVTVSWPEGQGTRKITYDTLISRR